MRMNYNYIFKLMSQQAVSKTDNKMNAILIISAILLTVNAGNIDLPYSCTFIWSFPNDQVIYYELRVSDYAKGLFGWIGVGIKNLQDGPDMTNADISLIQFQGKHDDSWSFGNGSLETDVSLGGTDDIQGFSDPSGRGTTYYSWMKPYNTGDSFDNSLVKDNNYYFLWAFGQVEDGEVQMHEDSDKGIEEVTFAEDFKLQIKQTSFISLV